MEQAFRSDVGRVAAIGCGVIGASWVSQFLARGLDVVAWDPDPAIRSALPNAVSRHWPVLTELGLSPGADPGRLRVVETAEEAVAGVDFVQESGPERIAVKQALYARLDAAAPADVVIASSSSGLKPSAIQAGCTHGERILVGHPFNPPHLIPLVEVVGGTGTAEGAIEAATAFYRAIGKRPIRIRKELVGHVANRLQAALWREAYHLVETGAISVADVDAAIAHGPGLRWALMGPILLSHLSGGSGGLDHMLSHLGPLIQEMWDDLGSPRLTEELKETMIAGVDEEIASIDLPEAVAERDRLLAALLTGKAGTRQL